jgi:taurine dioxygenase
MSMIIRPFAEGIGAEVLSFDASKPLTDNIRGKILSSLFEHHVLVFRAQKLTVGDQIQFTEGLGELEIAWDTSNTHPEDTRVQIITNAGRKNISYRTSSQYWHTDRSFVKKPSFITLLHAIQLPPFDGDTLFADMRRAYETLPIRLKELVQGLSAYHSYRHQMLGLRSRRVSKNVAEDESLRYPEVIHPLVRTHPITRRKALYLSELSISKIVDLEESESNALLKELYEHALQPRFIYTHKWQAGDLLVWDNPTLMHRVSDIPSEYPRVLHRTTMAGPVPI